MSITRSPAWQALSLIEEMFGYFTPTHKTRKAASLPALDQMYAYYSRR